MPFGKQTVQGVVFRFIDQPSVPDVKEMIELVDPEPVLTQAQIALAEAMAESTLSSLASIVSLFLPAGLSQQVDTLYEIRNLQMDRKPDYRLLRTIPPRKNSHRRHSPKLLQDTGGSLRGRQIDTHFSKVDWRKTAQLSCQEGCAFVAVCVCRLRV